MYLTSIAAEIVVQYLNRNQITKDELPTLLTEVTDALRQELDKREETTAKTKDAE
jgi:predicted transcriptional regulator